VFELRKPRHHTGGFAMEIVSFLPHREGRAIVHSHGRKRER